ncbi:hypothetical protein BOTBODRAFT_38181 [Botryobasidium botryosum FD-172 SS1]|uniref:Uncharacterized protein n=1 Tax=Botryobasidium botryosum (strain FD-172 SS1) TaxID=930990 RepID=A0A067M0J7_BOTB1|nr:hypothetical protein BOTBODRAFT_38181 [Botryobasidium botryosum FD-172 SS1]
MPNSEVETDVIVECFPPSLIQAAFSLRSRTMVKQVPGSVRRSAVQAIDALLEEVIRSVSACHNQLQAIDRLPNELLAMIFEFTVLRGGLNTDQPFQLLQSRVPVSITQVSSRWRGVAVAIPQLWTTIDCVTRPLASLFISRSQHTPLDIYILGVPTLQIMANDVVAFLTPLLPHIARWRILHIRCEDLGSIPQLLSAPAPLLEELDVTLSMTRRISPIMRRLFADCTPRLRALRLNNVPLHLTAPTYTGLISLHVTYSNHRDPMGTIAQLHRALATCPLLEDLFCDYSSFSTLSVFSMPRGQIPSIPIDLPHLQNAELVFWTDHDLLHFLAPIYFSPSLRLKLRVIGDADCDLRGAYPTTTDMMSHLPSIFLARQMQISSYPFGGPESYLHNVRAASESTFGQDSGQVEQRYLLQARYPNVSRDTRFHRCILKPFPLQLLESLVIEGFHGSEREFIAILMEASSLTAFTLSSLDHANYVVHLVAKPSFCLCPRLRALHIKNMNISAAQLIDIATSRTKMVDKAGYYTEDVSRLRILKLEGCRSMEKVKVDQILKALSLDVRWKYHK